MEYNTKLKSLSLPEYGRNIQNMVNYCLTIEDRTERTAAAYSIIKAMETLFPHIHELSNYKQTLWDHLAIMSNFTLDVDYPCEIIKKDKLKVKPGKVEYSSSKRIHFMHYGKLIHGMIEKACDLPHGEERELLELRIANYMKRSYYTFNKDGADDSKILNDLSMLSHGEIRLMERGVKLVECKANIPNTSTGKKKKKK